jgi:uncharacterized protein YigE (DUF2233 family)
MIMLTRTAMNLLNLFVFFVLIVFNCSGQFVEKHNASYNGNTYDAFVMKVDSALTNNCGFVTNTSGLSEKGFFQSLGGGSFFAVTASIVDSNCNPIGLLIDGRKELFKINLAKQGVGNFYTLLPNGVFSIDDDDKPWIRTSEHFDVNKTYKVAVQTGPFLVLDGGINTSFTASSKNKFLRCGLGIMYIGADAYIVVVKSNSPINFYDMANIFRDKYQCGYAIILESGIHSSMHLPTVNNNYSDQVSACRYFVIRL